MWTKENIPDMTNKIIIITGGSSGIGYEVTRALYEAGAKVIIASRNIEDKYSNIKKLKELNYKGNIEIRELDLSSLSQIKKFVEDFKYDYQHLDILINNAGVMMPPRGFTKDGFEMQFGTNFLGHFALTGYLYPLLQKSHNSRVVTLSSGAYKRIEKIDYENLRLEKSYDPAREYAISKLANLLFVLELQRRINDSKDQIFSLGAHPGITRTNLQRHIDPSLLNVYKEIMMPWQGALPTLYAATSLEVQKGQYYGPDGEKELIGFPTHAFINEIARDKNKAKRLWDFAEDVTGISYPKN